MLRLLALGIIVTLLCFGAFGSRTLAQVTPGVLQSAAQTATITGLVTQSDGTLVSGASVQVNGPGAHLITQSDVHGAFVFVSVPYGTYTIVATAANFGTTAHSLVVKGDVAVAIQFVRQSGGGNLKEIAHVSTQSSGARINVTPTSIASINPSDYMFQGNTSWRQLLDQIPGVTVGGDLSENRAPGSSIPNSPLFPIVISINGALPYETSETLDGMPLESQSVSATPPGSGTDLSYLPMSTFDTADVVRGPGADSPSIVDSIGGSFVLHAPAPVEKSSYEFSFSNDPWGGTVANAKVGLRFGKLSALLTYGVNDSPGPTEGIVAGFDPGISVTANGQPLYPNVSTSGPFPGLVLSDSLVMHGGTLDTAWKQHNGSIALSYSITPSISAEVFYAGSSTVQNADDSLRPVNFLPASSYTGSIAPGTYNWQQAFFLPTYSQSASLLEEKVTAYIWGGALRLAALQGNSFVQTPLPQTPSANYTLYGTGCLGTAAPNPNCPSGGTLTPFNGTPAFIVYSPQTESSNQWTNSRDLLLSYARQIGTRSTLGFSYVTSYYNEPASLALSIPGNIFLSQTTPPSVSETTNELRLHATSEISDKLSLDASWYAARGTYHVPDPSVNDCVFNFPSAVPGFLFSVAISPTAYKDSIFSYSAPRLGATWRASSNTVIRASAGGGFALPPLNDLSVPNSSTPICSRSSCTLNVNNLNLQPEKSFAFDIGTDLRLHQDTVLSFDLYRANLYGQFFKSAATPVPCSTLAMCLPGDGALPLYTTQEGNLSQSRMEGINLEIRHDVPKGIYWQGALGLTRGYVVSVPAGFYNNSNCPTTPCANTFIIPGINYDGFFQSTVPYANGSATIGYRWAPGKYIDLSPTYYGNNNAYYQPAFVEFNAHAGYPLTKDVSLLATFQNITGIYDASQGVEFYAGSLTAPLVAGATQNSFGLYAAPFGPRAITVTVNIH